jgi:hypothetical protein
MNEHGFVKSIHNKLSSEVHKWKIHDTYAGGVPDAFYSGPLGVLFIEYKYIKALPKRDNTILRHTLSKLQIEWLNKVKQGAKVAVVIGVEDTAMIITDNFDADITRQQYLESCVARHDVSQWIYEQTYG